MNRIFSLWYELVFLTTAKAVSNSFLLRIVRFYNSLQHSRIADLGLNGVMKLPNVPLALPQQFCSLF